jgi:hypothetical protein
MRRTDTSYQQWLEETFGRAVTGEAYPQFADRDASECPAPVTDELALEYLTRLFEHPGEALGTYSDRQIAAGLWELGPGDAHCLFNRDLPVEARLRLIGSVEIFFRDFFAEKCVPGLSHATKEHISPLNTICYMWWEVITWGWQKDDPAAEQLTAKDLDVMEAVLRLPNPASQEAAVHGLGHMIVRSDRALEVIDRFLAGSAGLDPALLEYARAARTGCIQ